MAPKTEPNVEKLLQGPVVLFDGECGFCNRWVQFIIRYDPQSKFRFAPLQSNIGRNLMVASNITRDSDSIVLIEKGHGYTESTAVLRICRGLAGGWKLLTILILVPRWLRDAIYRLFARNRHRFGKLDACTMPSPEMRARFLDERLGKIDEIE